MHVRRSVSAFDKWYRNIAHGKELCSKWKTDIRTYVQTFASRVEHGLGFATVQEPNSGHVPGPRYKRRYTTRSIIGSVRYMLPHGFTAQCAPDPNLCSSVQI